METKCNLRHCSVTFKGTSPPGPLRTHGLTDFFAISKFKLPERSNGKELSCSITYHCGKMEIIDLTGININNE